MIASALCAYVRECCVLIEHYVFYIVCGFQLVFRMAPKAIAKFLVQTGRCTLHLLICFCYLTLIK